MSKYKILGAFLHICYTFIKSMTKKEYYYEKEINLQDQHIIVFWHRKIFTVCNATKIIKKKASMVSASKDGEILSELLRKEGNELIRGSSNRDNVKSLKEAMRFVKNKYTLGIAIDGPKGPIFEPKAGAIFIAQKTGLPIVPINSYTNKKRILLKIWDRLEIPKLFSKNIHYIGEPFYIEKNMDIEEAKELIKEKIHYCGIKAYEIYVEKYLKNKNGK